MKMNKKVLSLISIVIYAFVLLACSGKLYTNSDEYLGYIDQVPGSDSFMPNLLDLPPYQFAEVLLFENYDSGKSINLVITYSEDEYAFAKDSISSKLVFLEDPLMEYDYYIVPQVEFEYKGFVIKVVSDDNFDYPEQFGMLGYSDAKFQISFLFFFNSTLHQLSNRSDRMTLFMSSDFRFPEEEPT